MAVYVLLLCLCFHINGREEPTVIFLIEIKEVIRSFQIEKALAFLP